ncbi:MAG TPA: MDR family MFS transporter [Acidimicrobiales bacterium]|nr:MDR family MFS transporter [Acidimicrobiales bacterium]
MSSSSTDLAETVPATREVRELSHRQVMLVFSGLMLGMLLAALDQTIVAAALPKIVGSLHGLQHTTWVVSAYLLASTVTTPLYGKISDLIGRKVVFQFAIVVFLIGSALSGLSQNMGELIAFRAVQGVGAGGLIALAMAIVSDVVSPRERGRYQGYFGAVFAFASVMGPLAGGLLTDYVNWRWVFYINLPIGAVALVVTSVVLRLPFRRQSHRVDVLGTALLVTGVSALLLVTVWGGSQYAWGSPIILVLGTVGAVLVAFFIWWERRATEPLLPPRLFRNDIFNVTSGLAFLQSMSLFGAVVFMPFYLQLAHGDSVTLSGLHLTPLMGGMLVTSIVSGRLVSKTGRYKIYPVIGTVAMIAGMVLMTSLSASTSYVQLSLQLALLGAGMGLVMQNSVLATQNAVELRDMGTATSGLTFFRSLGGVFGTAFFGAIFLNRVNDWMSRLLPPGQRASAHITATGGGFNLSPEAIAKLPAPVRHAVTASFVHGIDTVFWVAVPFAVVTFVLALLLREIRLRESAGLFAEDEVGDVAGLGVQDEDGLCAPVGTELALVSESVAPAGVERGD